MKAIIEMPKGDKQRRHWNAKEKKFVDLGLIKDVIPVNDGIMPIDYGFISGTLNKSDNDEIDVLIISNEKYEIGQEVDITPIAIMIREDGDDKVVAVGKSEISAWEQVPENQRQLIIDFFSFHSKILSIENKEVAVQYIKDNSI